MCIRDRGNTESINNIALPAGVPIIAGEEGICSGCGVATLSISYYDIGYTAGLSLIHISGHIKSLTFLDRRHKICSGKQHVVVSGI